MKDIIRSLKAQRKSVAAELALLVLPVVLLEILEVLATHFVALLVEVVEIELEVDQLLQCLGAQA